MYAVLTIINHQPIFMVEDSDAGTPALWEDYDDAVKAAQDHDLFAVHGYAILDTDNWDLEPVTGPL